MRFEKWQALGNDYLIVERDELPFELTPARVRRLCEGHFGVFADGVLLLSRPEDPAYVADLRIFNPDGSEAELSGNGAREAILYLRRRGWTDAGRASRSTPPPGRSARRSPAPTAAASTWAGAPDLQGLPLGLADGAGELCGRRSPAASDGRRRRWRFQHVSIGNPQCAIRRGRRGRRWRRSIWTRSAPRSKATALFPNRTNVSWYTELERARRPAYARASSSAAWGRRCPPGTGATGAAIAYVLGGGAGRAGKPGAGGTRVTVVLDGGELEVEVDEDLHVHLSGWALPVFEGSLSEEFVKELRELG